MKKYNLIFCCCFLILFSCAKDHELKHKEIKQYSIVYLNNSYSKLTVFDSNDTIYVSNKIDCDLAKYVKIKSYPKIINEIKNRVIENITPKSLLIQRDHITHSGYLNLEIVIGKRKITCTRADVGDDLKISGNFFNLFQFLKKKYTEIDAVF